MAKKKLRLGYTLIDETLPPPAYKTPDAACFDLYAREKTVVKPGQQVKVPVNLIVQIPRGYNLRVSLRSGTPGKKNFLSPNAPGVIDWGYGGPEDELKVIVYNFGRTKKVLEKGERFAQAKLEKAEQAELYKTKPAKKSRGGFGSTGSR